MSIQRPTTRVLTVLELLQAHGRMAGADLAARLEVDGRTLRRYIVMLEQLGIPIMAERGRYGGYSLVAGFKMPPLIFTDDEALALSVGLMAARNLGLEQSAPAIESAQAKLERVMPAGLKRRVRAINDTVKLDLPSPAGLANNAALILLSSAAQLQQRVSLSYQPEKQKATRREYDPYGLAYQNGGWYVVGYCHLRADLRSFRLDRVSAVELLEQHFVRPDNFDTVHHLRTAIATLPRAFSIEVLLYCDMAAAQRQIPAWLGLLEPHAEGVLLRSQADTLDWFARWLCQLDCAFRIQRPVQLRTALKAGARRLLELAST